MRILHVCLAAFYIDHYAYQENVLPRMHMAQGHDVRILASCETYIDHQKLGYTEPGTYLNEDGIPVTRLPYVSFLPLTVGKKLRLYPGIRDYLEAYRPEFVFLHDAQFLSIGRFVAYKKKYPETVIVADGHSDYMNSARSFVSKNILHKMIYRPFIRMADPFISRYYGTLPSRVSFFHEMYGINEDKLAFLPMGVDDAKLVGLSHEEERAALVKRFGLKDTDFLIATGGKFDRAKRSIVELIKAVNGINGAALLVFGSFADEVKAEVEACLTEKIRLLGWLDEESSTKVLIGSDLAVYPYLHSTLWEQTAGIGTPLLVKCMDGFQHINVNGNCAFLKSCKETDIAQGVLECMRKSLEMHTAAQSSRAFFSYASIAERVIRENVNDECESAEGI